MKRDLSRLLRPKSIAVIGGGWGQAVVEQCRAMGFDGPVWPVHPTKTEMHGVPCYSSVRDLPSAPDAAFIGVNRNLTIDIVRELSAIGAGGATCFASGFAEAEDNKAAGDALQGELVAAAGDMPVIGPNCYGLINYLDGALLWPDQHGGTRVETGAAILTQSSNVLINLTMQRRSLPLAYALTAGNQAQTGLADLAMAVLDDERVTALGLHIEGISDIRAFEALACRARELRKPVVAIKVGRSPQAQQAALSHTASLAGDDAASRAFLARLNIPVLDDLPSFLETLKLCHVHGALPGRTICSMSCSGGEASLMADAADRHDVDLRALTDDERDRVKSTLSDLVAVANPLDYHTFIWGDEDRMAATYSAMMGCGFDLSMLVYDYPRSDRCSDAAWTCGSTAIQKAVRRTGARTAVLASLSENMPENYAAEFLAAGIAPMIGFDESLCAVAASASIARGWRRSVFAPVQLGSAIREERTTLDEAAAKEALAQHGLVTAASRVATTAEDAAKAQLALGGRVALKGLGFAHKTEAGAVVLNLDSPDSVRAAASAMDGAEGFLIEEMIEDSVAELIVGVVRDAVYGFTLTIGAGGVLTELLEDRVTLIVPSSARDIEEAIDTLRISKVLSGYRGRPAANRLALVDAVLSIQAYAVAKAEDLLELDVNPLMVTPANAIAADALIVLER